jgi:hypothetical protein
MGNERIEGASYMPEQAGVDTWLKVLGFLWLVGATVVGYLGTKVRKIRDHDEQINALGTADAALAKSIAAGDAALAKALDEHKQTDVACIVQRQENERRLFEKFDQVVVMLGELTGKVERALALHEKHK